jgi:hypothetical protein
MEATELDLLAPCHQPSQDELDEHAQDVYWSSEYVPDDEDDYREASPFTEWLVRTLQGH